MATVIEICNKALARCGLKSFISSLSEATPEAECCNKLYETTRDAALAAAPWPFAKKQAVLALLDPETVTREGWTYCYTKPSDCISPRAIWSGYRNPTQDQLIPFDVMANDSASGEIICTDKVDAELIYTVKVTSPTAFHPLFVEALAWKLAIELSLPLSVRPDLRKDAIDAWAISVADAKQAAKNEAHEPMPECKFITERE